MSTFSRMMHCDGRTDRLTYQRNIALLAAGKAVLDLITVSAIPGLAVHAIALSWLNPFILIQPWLAGDLPFITCLGTFAFFSALAWNSVHRFRHAGYNHWFGLVTAVPYIGLPATVLLALLPGGKHSVWDIVG